MNKRITSALLAALLCMPLATGAAALDWSTTETPNGFAIAENEIFSSISITNIESHGYYYEDGLDYHVYYCSAPCKVTVVNGADLRLGSSVQPAFIADDGAVCLGKAIEPTYCAGEFEFSYKNGTYWELEEGVYFMWSFEGASQTYIVVGNPDNISLIYSDNGSNLYLTEEGNSGIEDETGIPNHSVHPGVILFSKTDKYGEDAYFIYNYDNPDESFTLGHSSYYIINDEGYYIIEDMSGNIVMSLDVWEQNDFTPSVSFTDVPETEYYFEPVSWAVALGITNGTAPTTFSPMSNCTRGQIITFLWRAAGCPEPNSLDHFTDVDKSQYYAKAAAWAYENGIASGKTFSPDDACTRLAAVEFMWKYDGSADVEYSASFDDVSSKAVNWAVENGITNGISATQFAPDSTCTRGQIVTFLYRAFA